MKTHIACSIVAGMLCHPAVPAPVGASENPAGPRAGVVDGVPVLDLSWELLVNPHLDPLTTSTWPGELLALDGKVVRLNGYVSLRPEAQDPVDLVITPAHPSNHECGAIKPTSMVEVCLPDGPEEEILGQPVEVCGRFELARVPGPRPFRILVLGWGPCTDPRYASAPGSEDDDGWGPLSLDFRGEDAEPRGDDFDGGYP